MPSSKDAMRSWRKASFGEHLDRLGGRLKEGPRRLIDIPDKCWRGSIDNIYRLE